VGEKVSGIASLNIVSLFCHKTTAIENALYVKRKFELAMSKLSL
jgi:hypothetical protein